MNQEIKKVKLGLFLVMLTLVFGISLGAGFGIAEDTVKSYISNGVSAHPALHDANSNSKIWRYAQRAHFHATGIAAFSIGLIVLVMFSSLKDCWKKYTAILIGLGGLYPLSWFSMFVLAPSIGRNAAHHHIITEVLAYCGVGGLLLGITILSANLFLGMFQND
ncbi:MAG: hypothetical protein GQ532_15110 [Methylomarinum sp.]|nr:hypothetical protein [Methylomarinum sp.]